MRKKGAIFFIMLGLILLAACGKTQYTVTFDSKGGSKVDSVKVLKGDKLPEPTPPTKDGFNFDYWIEGGVKFDFETRVIEKNITLVAQWTNKDNIPPAFRGAVEGKLPGVTHLKGETIDLLEGVSAVDETTPANEIELRVSDLNGYNKDNPGTYLISIEAKDKAGNTSVVKKEVVVKDTIIKTSNAIVIGQDSVDFERNTEGAFQTGGAFGMSMRDSEVVQVMTKDFFKEQYELGKKDFEQNGNVPYLPYGVAVILDKDLKVKFLRLEVGILADVDAEGNLVTNTFTNAINKDKPGGIFGGGFYDIVLDVMPQDGYIFLASSAGNQSGRKFLTKHFFYSEYAGGAVGEEHHNADFSTIEIELIEDHTEVLPLPDKLPAPVITIENHVLSWDAVPNALEYHVYVDGVFNTSVGGLSLPMGRLELDVTGEGQPGYKITVVAVTKDKYSWSTSDASDALDYIQLDQLKLDSPVLRTNGTLLEWNEVDFAVEYEVYLNYAGKKILLDTVEEVTFEFGEALEGLEGNNNLYVIAKGDNERYLDSDKSENLVYFHGEKEVFEINGYKTNIIRTNALNYFTRRGLSVTDDITGFQGLDTLFLITDIAAILEDDFAAVANESAGTVILLDNEGKPKVVNNILAKQTWNRDKKWHIDELYANNSAQLVNIITEIVEGDMLLVGRYLNQLTVENPEGEVITNYPARDFLSYFYINDNGGKGFVVPAGQEGWRLGIDKFTNPEIVKYIIHETINYETITVNEVETEISYNMENAFELSGTAKFRGLKTVQVMEKNFFLDQLEEYGGSYATNKNVVFFPHGVLVVLDNDLKVQQIRSAVGTNIQIEKDNQIKESGLRWSNAVDATNGGGLFNNLDTDLDLIIPDGGYVVFAPFIGEAPEKARTFMIKNFINKNYVSGAVNAADKNIDVLTTVVELN